MNPMVSESNLNNTKNRFYDILLNSLLSFNFSLKNYLKTNRKSIYNKKWSKIVLDPQPILGKLAPAQEYTLLGNTLYIYIVLIKSLVHISRNALKQIFFKYK